jgi:hypothetical protein
VDPVLVTLYESGTSAGARKAWAKRKGRGYGLAAHIRKVNALFTRFRRTKEPFVVHFYKRSDGSLRKMNAQMARVKPITGRGMIYDPKKYNLMVVYDHEVKNYRAIPLEGVKMVQTIAEKYRF